MSKNPKDPDAPSPVRRPDIPWNPYDPNNSPSFLTNKEWDDLWSKMTERRIKAIEEEEEKNSWHREQPIEYIREMVEALLGGEVTWEHWQIQNPSIKDYDFKYLDFFHEIKLVGVEFNKLINFFNARFAEVADFTETTFYETVHFWEAKFDKGADFCVTKFTKEAYFEKAIFAKHANFWEAIFTKDASFNKVAFAKYANFYDTIFTKRANFMEATFAEEADFIKTTFAGRADFNQATFDNRVIFAQAIFKKEVHFHQVTFSEWVNSCQTQFKKEANFGHAIFKKQALFNEAKFDRGVDFSYAEFQSSSFFNKTEFNGDIINFSYMVLSPDSNLAFENARFENGVPDFRYLNRIPDIRFHKFSVLSPDEWMPKNKCWSAILQLKSYRKRKWDEDNEDRYRKLKELAIGNHNHEYELKFYGYEMDSKLINFNKRFDEKKETKWDNKIWWMDIVPTRFYKCSSNYGQSIGIPMLAVLGVLFLWLLPLICDYIIDDDLLRVYFLFETTKAVTPFPIFMYDINSFGHFGIKIVASVFWFLLFLGLRNKFKIK